LKGFARRFSEKVRRVGKRLSSEPYASVVVPVHRRRETLVSALASVQRQSVREIEIVVAGDGVTPGVRETVEMFERYDSRIRFLDLPKGAGRGEANRDCAVRACRSERIFYIDDDDVFLPNHIQTLGPALGDSDFVESLPASGRSGGRLAVGFTNMRSPIVRELLAKWRLKLNFDTHVAHTASAYRRLPRGWFAHPEGRPVWRLFEQFATTDGLRFGVIPRVTAISLHSPSRSSWSSKDRRTEIVDWLDRTEGGLAEGHLIDADWVPHAFRLFLALPPSRGSTVGDYLSKIGISLGGASDGDPALAEQVVVDIPQPAIHRLENLMLFFNGDLRDPEAAADLAATLLEPLLGAEPPGEYVEAQLRKCIGPKAAEVMERLRPAAKKPSHG